jgi:hypothetical protein
MTGTTDQLITDELAVDRPWRSRRGKVNGKYFSLQLDSRE